MTTTRPAAALSAYTPDVARPPLPRPFFPSEPRSPWGALYVLVRRAGAAGLPAADVPPELADAVEPLVKGGALAWTARASDGRAVLVRAVLCGVTTNLHPTDGGRP